MLIENIIKFSKNYKIKDFSYLDKEIKKIAKSLKENVTNTQITIEGSSGKGRKANIPWICFFLNEITKTAEKGYYVVLLFSKDMNELTLSLNQGYTYYKNKYPKNDLEKLKIVTEEIRKKIINFGKFTDFSLDLKKEKKDYLAKGYEVGHICGKTYKINLDELKDLTNDIKELINIYEGLKKVIGVDIDKFNDKILIEDTMGILDNSSIEEDKCFKKALTVESLGFSLSEEKIDFFPLKNIQKKHKVKKVNYEEINIAKRKIGFIGEKIVLELEKEKLKKLGYLELIDKIEHTSIDVGDGTGYDIKSFDENKNEMYIEVKTTTAKNPNENVFISFNEVEFSKNNKDNYALYLIYELDCGNKKAKILKRFGSIEENFLLKPNVYKLIMK